MKKLLFVVFSLLLAFRTNNEPLPQPAGLPLIQPVLVPEVINDLTRLETAFRNKVIFLIKNCASRGIELRVVETLRNSTRQDSLKRSGRRVTNLGAGESRHQYGLAVDVRIIKHKKGDWVIVGREGERLGLRWGGRWRRPYDPGHFEWKGLTTADLIAGTKPPVPDTVYIPI